MTVTGRTAAAPADGVERAFDRAAGSRSIPGNQVDVLFDGPAVFEAMMSLMDYAVEAVRAEQIVV